MMLEVPPLYHDWLISLKDENEKGLDILVSLKGGGYERHLLNLIFQRGNCFSIVNLLYSNV